MCRYTLLPLVHGSLQKYWQYFLPKGRNARHGVNTLQSTWRVRVNSAIRWGTANHHTSFEIWLHRFIVMYRMNTEQNYNINYYYKLSTG